jgi:hypothetical protein
LTVAGSGEAELTGAAVGPVDPVHPVEFEPVVEGAVDTPDPVDCGQDALAEPLTAASMPQMVRGTVTPVPGLPVLPIGAAVDPEPVQTPLALPARAAVTPQTVT